MLAYAAGAVAHASGFLAVYVAGVVLGNARLPHRQAILGFADGLAWLAQIGLFVLLGLLASPGRLDAVVLPALVVGLRRCCCWPGRCRCWCRALPFRVELREQAFLSWAGLRGAVPIVLATIPLSERMPGATGPLRHRLRARGGVHAGRRPARCAPAARRLGVTAPGEATELRVETAPLERMRADLLQLEVPAGSRLAGVHIDELRLPGGRRGHAGAPRTAPGSSRARTPGCAPATAC